MIRCPLCKKSKSKTCSYHAAAGPEALFTVLQNDLKKYGPRGLVRMALAGQSTLVNLPDEVLDALAEDLDQVTEDFTKLLEKEHFDRDDLLLLAALSLVLGALHADPDEPDEPKAAPIDEKP